MNRGIKFALPRRHAVFNKSIVNQAKMFHVEHLCYNEVMKYPNFSLEKKLIQQGYCNIVGIDEAGRGAWAGPIVAVATMTISNFQIPIFKQIQKLNFKNPKFIIKDSKLLSEIQREKIFEVLSKNVVWAIGLVSHREIDKRGITWANITVVKRALKKLEVEPDYLLIDQINGFKHRLPHQLIIDGDRKIMSIAMASILAKVSRDRIMREYHQKYPHYHFHRHKGYGTALHQKCLEEFGVCKIHRKSYAPIRQLTERTKNNK